MHNQTIVSKVSFISGIIYRNRIFNASVSQYFLTFYFYFSKNTNWTLETVNELQAPFTKITVYQNILEFKYSAQIPVILSLLRRAKQVNFHTRWKHPGERGQEKDIL